MAVEFIDEQIITSVSGTFSVVSIPSGYKELHIILTGATTHNTYNDITLNFGKDSIDTGANYSFKSQDNNAGTNESSSTYIGTTRTAFNYNGSVQHSLVDIFVFGVVAGSKHVIKSMCGGYGGRIYSFSVGQWDSSDEISLLLIGDFSGNGFAVGSKCIVYGRT